MRDRNKKIILTAIAGIAIFLLMRPLRADILHSQSEPSVKQFWEKRARKSGTPSIHRLKLAVEKLERAKALNPFDRNIDLTLSSAYLLMNDDKKAAESAGRGTTLGKTYLLYTIIGTAYLKAGDYFLAKKALDTSLGYNPEFKDAQYNYGEAVKKLRGTDRSAM